MTSTPIGDMVERMLAANAPAASIVDAVRTTETVTTRHDERHDASRSREAERAARYRKNLKLIKAKAEANDAAFVDNHERDASRRSVTERCDLTSFLSSESQEETTEQGSKKVKKESSESARARGSRMVAGAVLTDDLCAAAVKVGAAAADVPSIWVEFVDYWVGIPGSRGLKLDWPATWRNRVRDVLKRQRGHVNGKSSLGDVARELAAEARVAEREAGIFRSDADFGCG